MAICCFSAGIEGEIRCDGNEGVDDQGVTNGLKGSEYARGDPVGNQLKVLKIGKWDRGRNLSGVLVWDAAEGLILGETMKIEG
jgi:hypothetical protein